MTPERWQQIKEIFYAAQEVEGQKRAAFLSDACEGDDELKREVKSLLASHADAEAFIESPVFPSVPLDDGLSDKFIGQRIGAYRVLREVGHGGMGVVFEAARDDEFRQQVALKLIRRGLDTEDILRRFRNERQILAALSHPNIARLLDGGSTGEGLPYFVMEFIEGLPLLAYCEQNDLSIEDRIKLFRSVCEAVAYAHRNLIIHRDLKPSNILITNDGDPKLLDFGVGKFLGPDPADQTTETRTALRVMTPEYASPEQVRGLHVTTATDIYSLGVVLYELLTGCRPYNLRSGSPEELSRAICESEPPKPSEARSEPPAVAGGYPPANAGGSDKSLRGDLDNIILMAMRKEPQRRYVTVEQFSEDLRRHLEGLPVIARSDTFRYRTTKFVQRHKVGAVAAALILLSLFGGLIATIWQSRVARTERDRARIAQAKAERINRFMQNALGAPDPNKEGRDVKVIDVLEKAAQRAQTELAGQPEVLAEVQRTIGYTYYNLELYDKGEPLLRSALKIFQETLGERHPTTAGCMRDLCNLLSYQEKYEEAIPLLQKTVEIYGGLQPAHARDLANAKYSLAQAYYFKGDTRSAEPIYRELLDFATKSFGSKDNLVAEAGNDLANILRDKDYEGAIALYRQAAEIVRPQPDKRMNLATCLSNLGVALTNAGSCAEAEGVLQESFAIRRELFGEQSPSLAIVLVNQSRGHYCRDSYELAEQKARRAVEIQKIALPPKHRSLATSLSALGAALVKKGKLAEAEKFLREGIQIYSEKYSKDDRGAASAKSALGECLAVQKRYEEAEPLMKDGYETLKAKLGDNDPATIEARNRLSLLQRK